MLIPVLDNNNKPLMSTSLSRAWGLIRNGKAKIYYQKGIFTIKLLTDPSSRNSQPIALGVDSGSKREGYTVLTSKKVVLNITTDTPDWVKDKIEARRNLRRSRRYRKTPYRACRNNRSCLKQRRIAPSTFARWNAKLRIIKQLLKILPITHINVEDIKAITKKGKSKHNLSFSPLEVGKNWFYTEIQKLGVSLSKTLGFQTKEQRDKREFKKSKQKLDYVWEAHNVDSHCLAEMALEKEINPYLGLYQINFLNFYRRQLHVQNFASGGKRKQYGTTVSCGISRGSVLKFKDKFYLLGGTSKGKISIHDIKTGKRFSQNINIGDIRVMYNSKQRTQFLPRVHSGVSLRRPG